MERTYYQQRSQGGKITGPGLLHVVYGQGVGKTSRCVGLAVRAAAAGLKVAWVQFMKDDTSSEVKLLRELPGVRYFCPGPHSFITKKGPDDTHRDHARRALQHACELVQKQQAQVLICDEILNTLLFKVLPLEDVLSLVELCRGRVELVMSGADVHPALLEAADYATELVQRKHPYYQGIEARKGIEF